MNKPRFCICLISVVVFFFLAMYPSLSFAQQKSALNKKNTFFQNDKTIVHIKVNGVHDTCFQTVDTFLHDNLKQAKNITGKKVLANRYSPVIRNTQQNIESIIVNGSFTLTIDTTGTECGYSNGRIVVLAFGGIAPYTYTSTYSGYSYSQSTGNFENLLSGLYSITVTDSSGQNVSTSINLSNNLPPPRVTTAVTKDPSQCASYDGVITLTGSKGLPPYSYSLDGINYQSSNVFTNLSPGFYAGLIKDANGCSYLDQNGVFLSSFNYINCFEVGLQYIGSACGNSSSIEVDVSRGGTPPYEYSLDGGVYQSSTLFDSVGPGLHSVTFRDAAGITVVETIFIFPYCPTTYISTTDATCHKKDGLVKVTPALGNAPFTYSLDGINYQDSNTFTGLAPGNYTVSVKDAEGFESSVSFSIFAQCPAVTAVATDETCGQKNGTITASAYNGAQPYEYAIDGIHFQSSAIFKGLIAGNYTITSKDSNGDTATVTVIVKANCLQLSVTITNSACSDANGKIIITATNGIVPFQYSIDSSNFQANNYFTGLSAGSHLVTVIDAANARSDTVIMIGDSPGPEINAVATSATCVGTDGSIVVNYTGGTSPLVFSIDSTNFQANPVFNNLDSGKYTAYAKDANGCTGKDSVYVSAPPTPVVFIGNDTSLCKGEHLLLAAPAGQENTYLWQDNTKADTFNVTGPGIYFVKVTNKYNCSSSDTVNINYIDLPDFSIGRDTTLCDGEHIVLNPVPSLQGSYLWNTGDTSASVNVSSPGTYWLRINSNGCEKIDSIRILFTPRPVVNLASDTTICNGEMLTLNVADNNSSYLWQDGSTQPSYTITGAGIYSVTVSMNGCDAFGSIDVSYLPKPILKLGEDTTICINETLLLNATNPESTYLWQDGSTQSYYQVIKQGVYTVSVINSCGISSASVTVETKNCDCKFYIPSAFTPNNDGINDAFQPSGECVLSNYELRIYNRWGQLVYESSNALQGWDGTLKGEPQPVGIYVYQLSYKDGITGTIEHKKGIVTLLR